MVADNNRGIEIRKVVELVEGVNVDINVDTDAESIEDSVILLLINS